jgi:hypothetical protein
MAKKEEIKLPKSYKAPKGSKRRAMLQRAAKLYRSGNKQAAYRLRERMERIERGKKGFKVKKSKFSKKDNG